MKKRSHVGFLFLFTIFFTTSFLFPTERKIFYLIGGVIFFGFFFIAFKYLSNLTICDVKIKVSKKRILYYATPCVLIWMLYLIAFFPGVMTDDSMGQWEQMITGKYGDWHPAIHTFFNFVITRLWMSPAAIAIAQIFILALTFGYGMYTLEKAGVNRKLLTIATMLFSLNPVNGILTITLWKDILYACFILLYTIVIINIIIDKAWIKASYNKLIFILSGSGTMLFRHNGVIVFVVTSIILLFIYRKSLKPYIICTISVILVYGFVKGPVYNMMRVQPGSSSEAFGIPIQQISAVIRENGKISEEQLKVINRIMPAPLWGQNYVPINVDFVKFQPQFKRDEINNNKGEFIKTWVGICIQNPKTVIRAYLNQTRSIWQIRELGTINTGSRKIVDNAYGIYQPVLNSDLTNSINKILDFTHNKRIIWLFWKPALSTFTIIFVLYAAFVRGFKKSLLAALPVLLNSATLLIAVPAQDFRYLYSNTLVVLILVVFSIVTPKDGTNINTY